MWNDYQITFAMAQESRLEIKTSAAVAEAGSIRNRMAEMGTVNPGAMRGVQPGAGTVRFSH